MGGRGIENNKDKEMKTKRSNKRDRKTEIGTEAESGSGASETGDLTKTHDPL